MTDTAADALQVELDGRVATLTINRPESHNALNAVVFAALSTALDDLVSAGEVGAIVITGAGDRAFSAGADLNELAGLDPAQSLDLLSNGQHVLAALERAPVPIIAAVNGLALGGGFELVLACTFPVVSSRAAFGLPESGLGLIPGYGGTQRLPRLVGRAVAAHLMLSGDRMSADRAHQLGLAPLPPIEPDKLMATASELALAMAARGPRAQESILQALRTSTPTRDELAIEATLAALATGGAESDEGIAAFRDRRTPVFPARGRR